MSLTILDGLKIRDEIQAELGGEITALKARGITPGLAAVLVGENPASQIYVRSKVKACESLGLYSEKIERPATMTTEELLELVGDLNRRDEIDGILVQLPLPTHIDTRRILEAVDPAKDVDGFHPTNVGRLVAGRPNLVPCTPAGIMEMLRRYQIPIAGARAIVVGRSDIVGKPMALLLLHQHATVTICHSRTHDLPGVAREADILVAAMGRPAFVTGDFIRQGATVIDVGMNRLATAGEVQAAFHDAAEPLRKLESKGSVLIGDVQPEDARERAGAYTPVPGGVGPLTIAMLMSNTVKAATLRRGSKERQVASGLVH
jgi:methylenetetrahydrofolate dehydrogenase (NADP+) / methenyltetrahydrofolate cyclohydrolase